MSPLWRVGSLLVCASTSAYLESGIARGRRGVSESEDKSDSFKITRDGGVEGQGGGVGTHGGDAAFCGGESGGVDSVDESGELVAKALAAARVVSGVGTVGFRDSLEWLCWVTWQLENSVS
jgi:hypothetical protein